ncbi:MAG: ArsA-related P-loop ATPase [Acidobacteriota bacterium]
MSAQGYPLDLTAADPPLVIAVGSGGVGKTTVAASMGLVSARAGVDTLVMTFDPSLRLKDALGVDQASQEEEVEVPLGDIHPGDAAGTVPAGDGAGTKGQLFASLLDARRTFDRLVARYAPDDASRDRILTNEYYGHLAGHLGGILEYMAVERLYEVSTQGRYDRIILDTPPTAQAIEFLEAPSRVVSFLESGALKIALRPWFDGKGKLKVASGMGFLGRGIESFLDRVVGLDLLRDMSEFFLAFEPLFEGFKDRAFEVERLLGSDKTLFVLVTGPGEGRVGDSLFFARRLREAGYRLGPVVVNRMHPTYDGPELGGELAEGDQLFRWLGSRHRGGLAELRRRLPGDRVVALPLEADEPTDLTALESLGRRLVERLEAAEAEA